MVEVEMAVDIRKFEPKSVGPFTLRQAVCIALPLVYGVPFAVFVKSISIDTRILIAMMIMAPIWMCGFVKLDGQPLEIYAMRYIYFSFLTPRKRKYSRENKWKKLYSELEKEEKNEMLKGLSKKELAQYQKENKKGTVVKYSDNPEYSIHK